MSSSALDQTCERLCRVSREQRRNPRLYLCWPETLDREQWFMSPELVSLAGTETFGRLSEDGRKRLSFFEAVHFFSMNVHGERALAGGVARRLRSGPDDIVSDYLRLFLGEEHQHTAYFERFCRQYAGKLYPEKKPALLRHFAPGEEDLLFFTKVLIFEEIVDAYNRRMARDTRLVPIAREINAMHHFDEVRHLAFGRALVADLFSRHTTQWCDEVLRRVRRSIAHFVVATWRELYNPAVYRDAGVVHADAFQLRRETIGCPVQRERRQRMSHTLLCFLRKHQILLEEPVL